MEVETPKKLEVDDLTAHAKYDRLLEALREAQSLSYSCRYEREGVGQFKTACTYRVWLKKPNYFRMETQAASGEPGGILVGDGEKLWIHWSQGRPKWANVEESAFDENTRLTSYMTKPTPRGKHSIWHEAVFLGAGMVFPVLDMSTFHGHVDSLAPYLDGVKGLGRETVAGEACEQIEVSFASGQRRWRLWLSERDHLPRKLQEVIRSVPDQITNEEWSDLVLNGEIPPENFAWTPPSDWQEWRLPDDKDRLLKPGARAPDFELPSVAGEPVKLSKFRGQCVWLCFWRVGCPPCRVEMPQLQDLYGKYKDSGLVVLAINDADDRDVTLDYLRDEGITFPNVLDTTGAATKVVGDYGGGTLPTNYLIDEQGIVVDAWFGLRDGADIESMLLKSGGRLREAVLRE